MSKEERSELGRKGAEHVRTNYNFEDFQNSWEELMTNIYENHGSWANRKGYKSWEVIEIA